MSQSALLGQGLTLADAACRLITKSGRYCKATGFDLAAEPGRELIMSGTLYTLPTTRRLKGIGSGHKDLLELFALLCNDIMVVTKPTENGLFQVYSQPIDLAHSTVANVFYNDNCDFLVEECFRADKVGRPDELESETHVFRAGTERAKLEWVRALFTTIQQARGEEDLISLPEDGSGSISEILLNYQKRNSFMRSRSSSSGSLVSPGLPGSRKFIVGNTTGRPSMSRQSSMASMVEDDAESSAAASAAASPTSADRSRFGWRGGSRQSRRSSRRRSSAAASPGESPTRLASARNSSSSLTGSRRSKRRSSSSSLVGAVGASLAATAVGAAAPTADAAASSAAPTITTTPDATPSNPPKRKFSWFKGTNKSPRRSTENMVSFTPPSTRSPTKPQRKNTPSMRAGHGKVKTNVEMFTRRSDESLTPGTSPRGRASPYQLELEAYERRGSLSGVGEKINQWRRRETMSSDGGDPRERLPSNVSQLSAREARALKERYSASKDRFDKLQGASSESLGVPPHRHSPLVLSSASGSRTALSAAGDGGDGPTAAATADHDAVDGDGELYNEATLMQMVSHLEEQSKMATSEGEAQAQQTPSQTRRSARSADMRDGNDNNDDDDMEATVPDWDHENLGIDDSRRAKTAGANGDADELQVTAAARTAASRKGSKAPSTDSNADADQSAMHWDYEMAVEDDRLSVDSGDDEAAAGAAPPARGSRPGSEKKRGGLLSSFLASRRDKRQAAKDADDAAARGARAVAAAAKEEARESLGMMFDDDSGARPSISAADGDHAAREAAPGGLLRRSSSKASSTVAPAPAEPETETKDSVHVPAPVVASTATAVAATAVRRMSSPIYEPMEDLAPAASADAGSGQELSAPPFAQLDESGDVAMFPAQQTAIDNLPASDVEFASAAPEATSSPVFHRRGSSPYSMMAAARTQLPPGLAENSHLPSLGRFLQDHWDELMCPPAPLQADPGWSLVESLRAKQRQWSQQEQAGLPGGRRPAVHGTEYLNPRGEGLHRAVYGISTPAAAEGGVSSHRALLNIANMRGHGNIGVQLLGPVSQRVAVRRESAGGAVDGGDEAAMQPLDRRGSGRAGGDIGAGPMAHPDAAGTDSARPRVYTFDRHSKVQYSDAHMDGEIRPADADFDRAFQRASVALDDYRVELERLDVPEQHAGDGGLIRPAEVRGPTPVSGSDIGYASDASASAVHLATINSRPLSIASSVAAPASGSFRRKEASDDWYEAYSRGAAPVLPAHVQTRDL